MLARCLMSLSDHLLRPEGIGSPCFSFIRFIVVLTVTIAKDKYLTPAHILKSTRSSHCAQYCRYQTYSDALKNSFFPQTIPQWNSLFTWVVNSKTTLRSLGHSSFSQKHSRKIFFKIQICTTLPKDLVLSSQLMKLDR